MTTDSPVKHNPRDVHVAAEIRRALGPFNDWRRPVIEIVAELVAAVRAPAVVLDGDNEADLAAITALLERNTAELIRPGTPLPASPVKPATCDYCAGTELDPDNAELADWGTCPVCQGQGEAKETTHD